MDFPATFTRALLQAARLVRRRPPSTSLRDETLRAGQPAGLTPEQAALRASGRNAWMRPGGFG